MRSVADMLARVLNIERECLDLRGLDEQQLLLLLNKYAFHGYNMDKHKGLQKIGNKIVKKLWGSPLAAKVIGSLLNSNMNFHYWKRILKCNSLINLEQAKEVADVLKLSYYHLSVDLQQCFRFCSIFPQDYLFEKNTLIRMWMASGFIQQQSRGEERPEDIGEEYFNHLLRKSFFEQHTQDKGENYYVMHDMMHELAQIVSRGECFRVDPSNNSVNIPSTAQHVSVPFCEIKRVFHLKNLRTLVITMLLLYEMPTYNGRFVLPRDSLKETLRVLSINVNFSYELPEEIDHLIHLRILEANEVSGTFLANSICKLYHLQVLDLMDVNSNFSGVETTKVRVTNLVNLRYMNIPDEIMINVYGVHKLTSLQELTFFVGHDSGRHIDELKTLNNLRHLCIKQIENVTDPAEVKAANLSKKESLLSLSLNWTEGINSDNSEQILDNLQPHPNIRELEIDYYNGLRSPIWMRDLPPLNLSSLMLSNCPLWEDLPFLAQMPHLKKLSLLGMSEVKQIDFSFDSTKNAYAFPSLEHLICDEMPKWQSWAGLLSCHGFPNLGVLKITNCPNLTKLPVMPLSLFYFKVENVGLNSLPDIYHNYSITTPSPSYPKSSLTEVILRYCPNLKSMNGFLQQENLDFQAVEILVIYNCENLVQLPTSAFGKFVSLKYLYIRGCSKLVPADNQRILLPVKLQTLIIGDCGELDVTVLESSSQLATLTTLRIIDSPTITYIPCSDNAFPSLSELHIQGCDKLVQHSLMKNEHGVNLVKSVTSLKINELNIPHHSLLSIEPLRSLRFVKMCRVVNCSGMEALPEQWLMQNSNTLKILTIENASSLRSLPDTMVRLTALKRLRIKNATLLEHIPELPPSLVQTSITDAGGRELV